VAESTTMRASRQASVRSRILVAALLPAVLFLGAVLGAGWWLSGDAVAAESDADLVVRKVDGLDRFIGAVLAERTATAMGDSAGLPDAREDTDVAGAAVAALVTDAAVTDSPGLRRSAGLLGEALAALPTARAAADAAGDGHDVYEAYEPVVEPATSALAGSTVGRGPLAGSDAALVTRFDAAAGALAAAVQTDDATLLAVTAGGRPDAETYAEYVLHASGLRMFAGTVVPGLNGADRERAEALIATPEWRTLTADVRSVVAAGPATPGDDVADRGSPADTTVSADYATAATTITAALRDIGLTAARDAAADQADGASRTLDVIVVAVLVAISLAVIAILVAVRTSGRLARRLGRLRDATLETAERLPAVLDRLRHGEDVDIDAVVGELDAGTDEIGEVAAAVDVARRTAIGAAADEARTRAGANAVFLNIAHRSQAIVHRQLQVLDEAERAEHNSDQLARLYQLDHLTTRERRNAENLIIMGGQQPRRRWRRPVSMAEVVRSAVSESEQYTRITLGDVPEAFVDGSAVGDLIHMLAELVDNATSFSPPQCPIDVDAFAVGRGMVVEVRDRGLGIDPEIRDRLNATLADPPELSILTLSEDSRLGLYVVARLAHRHGVRVTLAESPYGGVMAIVLVPDAILVEAANAEPDSAAGDDPAMQDDPGAVNGTEVDGGGAEVTAPRVAAPRVAAPQVTGLPTEDGVPAGDPAPEPVPVTVVAEESVEPPAVEPPADDSPAPLPERRPQAHLARELQETPEPDLATYGDEPPVERSRAAMSALQRSSRGGRTGTSPPSRNGDRP
jgi:signal transduction histidine kinase